LRISGKDSCVIYLLARTHSRHEFATATAINEMLHRPDPDGDLRPTGAVAVVPREIVITPAKDGKPEAITYRPLLPRLMFLACTNEQWHDFQHKRIYGPQGILPPIRREFDLLQVHWAGLQAFAARAEMECEYRIGCHEAGKKVANMRPGDIIRMISATIGDVDLAGRLGEVVRMDRGKVLVQTDVLLMGKPVVARLDPGQIIGMAAE